MERFVFFLCLPVDDPHDGHSEQDAECVVGEVPAEVDPSATDCVHEVCSFEPYNAVSCSEEQSACIAKAQEEVPEEFAELDECANADCGKEYCAKEQEVLFREWSIVHELAYESVGDECDAKAAK